MDPKMDMDVPCKFGNLRRRVLGAVGAAVDLDCSSLQYTMPGRGSFLAHLTCNVRSNTNLGDQVCALWTCQGAVRLGR